MVTALMTQLFQSPRRRCWAGVDDALQMHHEQSYSIADFYSFISTPWEIQEVDHG